MITILITLWLYGYDITLDAREIYNVNSIVECERILPQIKMQYKAQVAICHKGDILQQGEDA